MQSPPDDQPHTTNKQEGIKSVCNPRAVPGRQHTECQGGFLANATVQIASPNMEDVSALPKIRILLACVAAPLGPSVVQSLQMHLILCSGLVFKRRRGKVESECILLMRNARYIRGSACTR